MIGVPFGPPPDPVDLDACDFHLSTAQEATRNRTTRTISTLPPVQPDLFTS
jgi:hypothetical protein